MLMCCQLEIYLSITMSVKFKYIKKMYANGYRQMRYVMYRPAVSLSRRISTTSPLLRPQYLATGSVIRILGSWSSFTMYLSSSARFSSDDKRRCFGTISCNVILTTNSTSKKTLKLKFILETPSHIPWLRLWCSATINFFANDVMFLWMMKTATRESVVWSIWLDFHSSSTWAKKNLTSSIANFSRFPENRAMARFFALFGCSKIHVRYMQTCFAPLDRDNKENAQTNASV